MKQIEIKSEIYKGLIKHLSNLEKIQKNISNFYPNKSKKLYKFYNSRK